MSEIVKQEAISFIIPNNKINTHAVEKVKKFLPELEQKTKAFDRKNSQTTLSLMTLTMLCGQSPCRMMRQIMSEVEKRKLALAESQVTHAELSEEIKLLENDNNPVSIAKYRYKCVVISTLENKINGSFKDIATLIDAYNNIKETNNIENWDETSFEDSEKRFHVRRAFELMYRNLLEGGRAQTATIEYCQQYGVHPQVCLTEVSGYIQFITDKIKQNKIPHSNDLEEFLDQMADKYAINVDMTAERLFGKPKFTNKDYMYQLTGVNNDL